jgi:predicted DNA-binding ribbon-helix-helix protein
MADRSSKKHSITVDGHRTSITLENDFWAALKEIAAAKGKSVNTLIAEIDTTQPDNLSSALRIFILKYYKSR